MPTNIEIVSLYENSDGELSIDDICSLMPDLDKGLIRMVLENNSKLYREKHCAPAPMIVDKNLSSFNPDDDQLAHQAIRGLLLSENPSVALKAAKLIIDEKRGRRDVRSGLRKINFNINLLNTQLEQQKRARELATGEVIDIKTAA